MVERGPAAGWSFWQGVLTGLTVAAVGLAACVGWVMGRGITVPIPTGHVTKRLQAEVRTAVRRELPVVLEEVQRSLPRQVAAEAGRRIAGARIDLGGFQIPVPPAAVREVEAAVGGALSSGLEAMSGQVDIDGLADRLGNQAAGMADRQLKEMLSDQVMLVQVGPLQVPVRLIPQ